MTSQSGAAVSTAKLPTKVLALDIVERLFLVGMFTNFVFNMVKSTSGGLNPITMMLIVSESLPIILVCLRGPSATMSMRPSDWALGFAASSLPLLAVPAPGSAPLLPAAICVLLMMSGILLQTLAKIYLGRSFGVIAANRGVKVSGPYQYVRHPMYAGYVLTHIAFMLSQPNIYNLMVYCTALAVQIVRIGREEDLLSQDAGYRTYAAEVRHRLLPGVY